MTEQLQQAIDRDFPDNIVQKLVQHKTDDKTGQLMIKVQWLGFTKAQQTWQTANILKEDVPEALRKYLYAHKTNRACREYFERWLRENA